MIRPYFTTESVVLQLQIYLMLMVCTADGKVQHIARARRGTFLHLVTAELDHEFSADSVASETWLKPLNLAEMVVDIQPKPTERRRRCGVVEDQTSQSCVESELIHLFRDGVDHGILERDVDDFLAENVRFD